MSAPSAPEFDLAAASRSADRQAILDLYRADETRVVAALADEAALSPDALVQAQATARRLAERVRTVRQSASGVDALMHEFSLSSAEGVALMCLAEALLRIPDDATRDRLIRDKIAGGNWRAHLGASPSLFVNVAAWGLLVTGRVVATHSDRSLSAALNRAVRRGGEPLIRRGVDIAMRLISRQFVTGETIDEALAQAVEREARGYRFSYDMLGEAAVAQADAERYFQAYATAIQAIGKASAGRGIYQGPGISVKLSALHPRYQRAQRARVMNELLPRVKSLLLLARSYDIGFNIDAEEADRLDLSLDILEALALDPAFAGWQGIGFVVQAYQKRAPKVIDWIVALGRRSGHRLMVRLVKGAYWDSEIKRAQLDGLVGYPVYTRKVHTDIAYIACAKRMLAAPEAIYPQFATHNAFTIGAIHALAGAGDYEFQCLHGMGEAIYDEVVPADKLGVPCRVYAPVGSHETLLAYLVRRLLENGANTSFVNRIVDPAVSLDDLVADPVAAARAANFVAHPKIPLPSRLFTDRRNAEGLDLSDEGALEKLAADLAATPARYVAAPLLGEGVPTGGDVVVMRNPAKTSDIVGEVTEASPADVSRALDLAIAAGASWGARAPIDRAVLLEAWADRLVSASDQILALAVREAGKTLSNAVAELREAVDFCRYYAAQLRTENFGSPVGPLVCISPWNFPLAIFVGQVAAALAAGNPVLAKPAEQTPLLAHLAVQLAHQAGIPRTALQLLPGPGERVGAALVGDSRIAGVVFTGSTEVAKIIERTLARNGGDKVLIAETGGLNAMIADSSALIEEVVQAVLTSAFDSAGQRCSALRILCVQEDIADRVLTMLYGALKEMTVGDPARLATDIGPVIDAEAQTAIEAHVARAAAAGLSVHRATAATITDGTFVLPTVIELTDLSQLDREVFGPVLHVLRWESGELDRVITGLNAKGYGLTHGIQSRIDETVAQIEGAIRAGNVYVNRNIVGAVVGVQPFGGEGLSGTGPKAGGPLYLHRLTRAASAMPTSLARASVPATDAGAIRSNWSRLIAQLPATDDRTRSALLTALDRAGAYFGNRQILALPGPTGERNTLSFTPKGHVACVAATPAGLVAQALAALATGNEPILPTGEIGQMIRAAFADDAIRLAPDPAQVAADVILADLPPEGFDSLKQKVAAMPGPIVPVIAPANGLEYPLWRLFNERAVSVNTAAAGGNAALLALGDDLS